jgi:hypothetical protein
MLRAWSLFYTGEHFQRTALTAKTWPLRQRDKLTGHNTTTAIENMRRVETSYCRVSSMLQGSQNYPIQDNTQLKYFNLTPTLYVIVKVPLTHSSWPPFHIRSAGWPAPAGRHPIMTECSDVMSSYHHQLLTTRLQDVQRAKTGHDGQPTMGPNRTGVRPASPVMYPVNLELALDGCRTDGLTNDSSTGYRAKPTTRRPVTD